MLDALNALSPWWWVALGIGLIGAEMIVPAFFLIWPGLAALVLAGVLLVVPGLAGNVQVTLFAVLAVVATFAGRGIVRRRGQPGSDQPGLNRRTEALVGRRGVLVGPRGPDEAEVEVEGVRWTARMVVPCLPPGRSSA